MMDEITRTEKFLRACIDGEPCALKPLTRVEKLLAELNDKLAGAPSEVVILPETELTHAGGDDPKYIITTKPSAIPADGVPVDVTYNGVIYTCPVIHQVDEGIDVYAMGSLEIIGKTGGDSDAPFCVLLFPAGAEGVYGMCFVIDSPQAVTLSIVQTEGASGGGSASAGGGGFIVNGMPTFDETGTGGTLAMDKTFADTLAAIKSGRYVACHAPIEGNMAFPVSVYMDDVIVFLFVMDTTSYIKVLFHADETATFKVYNE